MRMNNTSIGGAFRSQFNRNGFTLVELLVVIAIIGVLMGLLLPAINAARESARRATCGNNIRQMALACVSYEETYHLLPPASNYEKTTQFSSPQETGLRANWIILCLPYLDQQALFNEMNSMLKQKTGSAYINVDSEASLKSDANVTMKSCRERVIPSFLCPSDGNGKYKFESGKSKFTGGRCNYGANMGLENAKELYASKWSDLYCRGVMGPGKTMRISEIADGTSNTILIAELRTGAAPTDCRGTWALGGAGPSAIAGCGYIGNARGPNAPGEKSDGIYGCDNITSVIDASQLLDMKMSCYEANNVQATSRSAHSGGVQTAFCDGSVHFISDAISVGEKVSTKITLGVWDKLILSGDGESLSNADF